ncbi:hypothetical protein BLSMQ_1812 [Brevibacterium aurantiacum]|uniref:Uncharacterized protein n=1 Tax=Brevibacterium aurantiacum TaxID=273384 RepID=A0A1D7W3G2_BREAU|nr:hypothetical protein BLSMQ_1812 [Brevibacterium aurantiacum]
MDRSGTDTAQVRERRRRTPITLNLMSMSTCLTVHEKLKP